MAPRRYVLLDYLEPAGPKRESAAFADALWNDYFYAVACFTASGAANNGASTGSLEMLPGHDRHKPTHGLSVGQPVAQFLFYSGVVTANGDDGRQVDGAAGT